jgi:hypothetical protein
MVLRTRLQVARGVIMCADQRGSVIRQRPGENFYLCVVDDTIRLLLGGAPRG